MLIQKNIESEDSRLKLLLQYYEELNV